MTHGHELKGGDVGGRGCAGQRGIKGGKWDNCNSIINKYILKRYKHHCKKEEMKYFEVFHVVNFFYCCSSIVVSIFFSPLPSTPAIPTSHPWSYFPLVLSMCPSYMFLKTLPLFPPSSPPTSPLVTISLFLFSLSLVIFCFLLCFVD